MPIDWITFYELKNKDKSEQTYYDMLNILNVRYSKLCSLNKNNLELLKFLDLESLDDRDKDLNKIKEEKELLITNKQEYFNIYNKNEKNNLEILEESLGKLHECETIGSSTVEELVTQTEKLKNTNNKVSLIHSGLMKANGILSKMKKWWR